MSFFGNLSNYFNNTQGAVATGSGPFYSAQSVDPKMRSRIRKSADISNIANALTVFNQGFLPALAGLIQLGRNAFTTPEPDIFIVNQNTSQTPTRYESQVNAEWRRST